MNTKIDVVIPTRNRGDLVVNTLKSLQESHSQDFCVWLVDQSEDDLTAQAIEPFVKNDPRCFFISSNTKGADVARNIGLQAGSSPIVAFIDDDCRVAVTWAEALIKEYEDYPDVSSVFGRVIPAEIPEHHSDTEESEKIKRLQQVLPMAKKIDTEPYVFTDENRFNLGFGHGANMSFRRSVFAEIGVFDEYLGGGGPLKSWEERDIGYRILCHGGSILYSPEVTVYHEHWRGWPDVRAAFQGYAIGSGAAVGKYVRSGDLASLQMLWAWIMQMGFRQILSGIFKWQSMHKVQAGLLQLIYPWVGLWQSWQYAIDPQYVVYTGKKGQAQKTPTLETPTNQ